MTGSANRARSSASLPKRLRVLRVLTYAAVILTLGRVIPGNSWVLHALGVLAALIVVEMLVLQPLRRRVSG